MLVCIYSPELELFVIEATTTQLRKTALNSAHRRMGAKMVNFGGWDMPVEYSGIVSEHLATRTAAGLFDVSHMGEIEVRGPQALDWVQFVTCNDASKLVEVAASKGVDAASWESAHVGWNDRIKANPAVAQRFNLLYRAA